MRDLGKIPAVLYILFIFFLPIGICKAQEVRLMNLATLEERLEAGGDTIFVLNFWATWCVPCVEEIPHFLVFSNKEHAVPKKLLFISLDSPSKVDSLVTPFVRKNQMLGKTSEVYVLNEKNQQKYIERIDASWSGAIPASLFITDGGKRRVFREQSFDLEALESTFQLFSHRE